MAAWLFTAAILEGRPIKVFNGGAMRRDFTYIDDIVAGIVAALDHPPQTTARRRRGAAGRRTGFTTSATIAPRRSAT